MQTAHLEVKLDQAKLAKLEWPRLPLYCQGPISVPSTSVQSVVTQPYVKLIATKRSEHQLPSYYLRAQQPQLRCPVSPVSPSQTPS